MVNDGRGIRERRGSSETYDGFDQEDGDSTVDGYYMDRDSLELSPEPPAVAGPCALGVGLNTTQRDWQYSVMDKLIEEVNISRVNKPTGFMGHNTTAGLLCWVTDAIGPIPSLAIAHNTDGSSPGAMGTCLYSTYTSTCTDSRRMIPDRQCTIAPFHMDSYDINQAQVDDSLPPRELADTLLETYFTTVHPTLPILDEFEVRKNYDKLYSPEIATVSLQWLATFNCIFGIAIQKVPNIRSLFPPTYSDPVLYLSRARVYGALDGGLLFKTVILHNIQNMALMGVLLFITKQLNRSVDAFNLL